MKSIKNLFIIIIVTIISLLEFSLISINSFQKFLSEENIKKNIEQVDLVRLMSREKSILNKETQVNQNQLIIDKIYQIAEKDNISKETIDIVINSSAVKNLASNYINNIKNYVLTGKEKNIMPNDLVYFIETGMNNFVDKTGIPLSDEIKQKILNNTREYSVDYVDLLPTTKSISNSINIDVLEVIRIIFLNEFKVIFLGIILLLMGLIIFLEKFSYKWIKWSALATLINAILCFGMSTGIKTTIQIMLEENSPVLLEFFNSMLDQIKINYLNYGRLMFIFTIIQIIVYVVICFYTINKSLQNMTLEKEK